MNEVQRIREFLKTYSTKTADEIFEFTKSICHPQSTMQNKIYEELQLLKTEVDDLDKKVDLIAANTAGIIEAMQALDGAFKVLKFIGKASVPIIWISTVVGALGMLWASLKGKS
jgi:hypothetical protein